MSTKQCPFCAEEIQEEAIKCKQCGEILDEQNEASPSPSPVGEEVAPKISEVKPKKISKGFLAGIVLGPLLWISIFSVVPLLGLLVALLAVGLGVLMFTKGQEKFRGIAVASFGAILLLIGGASMNSAQRMSTIQQEAEEFSQFVDELEITFRQAMPENYAQGMKLLKEKEYEGALEAFEKVAYVDPNYENLPEFVKEANEAFEGQKAAEQKALEAQK